MIIRLKDKKFRVKTVFSQKDTQKGMMGRDFDSSFNGMLFLMDDGEHCFWMKNCIINLDIIFISNNKITSIHHNCNPCTDKDCDNFCGNGDMVLEVRGGICKKIGLEVGDPITL